MKFIRQTAVILEKDLRSELRSKETVNSSISFSVTILLLFSFAFNPEAEQIGEFAGGLLWLVFAFAGALIINRSFVRDQPNDCLDTLLSSPVHPSALFLGKALGSFVLLIILEAVALPVFGIFYNIDWTRQLGSLMLVILLGSWGMAVVGTAFSALTVNLRMRELMLPMLVYPVMIPCLLGAIILTADLVVGKPMTANNWQWMKLLIGFDFIYSLLAIALADTLLVG